ncbi:MAG TPA: phosphatidate cytidylyltransferase [Gemmatimonadales bacterium]
MISKNLVQRVGFAIVAIPLAIAVIYAGGWLLAGVLAALGVLGTREIYDLARRQAIQPLGWAGYLASAALPLGAYWAKGSQVHWAEPAIFIGALWLLVILTAAMPSRGPGGRPLTAVAVTVFGSLYASALLAFIIPLRHGAAAGTPPWAATWLVLLPLALTWICDTCAMAAGIAIGGPKLAPVLSPKKTWAGAVGGLAGAVAAALALGLWVLPGVGLTLGAGELVLLGAVVGVLAQVGDVAESLFKREAGVKDSSALIPGHGGVLDRLDSLYFVVPATAGLFKLFGVL